MKRDTELTSTLNRRGQIESRGTERRQIFERGHGFQRPNSRFTRPTRTRFLRTDAPVTALVSFKSWNNRMMDRDGKRRERDDKQMVERVCNNRNSNMLSKSCFILARNYGTIFRYRWKNNERKSLRAREFRIFEFFWEEFL